MHHEIASPIDFIDPGHRLDHEDRRVALVAIFVPVVGLVWLNWEALFGESKDDRLVYLRFSLLAFWLLFAEAAAVGLFSTS